MADCRFDTQDDLTPLEVKINIPPNLKGKQQFQSHELVESQRIASLHIHAKRAMERLKTTIFLTKHYHPL